MAWRMRHTFPSLQNLIELSVLCKYQIQNDFQNACWCMPHWSFFYKFLSDISIIPPPVTLFCHLIFLRAVIFQWGKNKAFAELVKICRKSYLKKWNYSQTQPTWKKSLETVPMHFFIRITFHSKIISCLNLKTREETNSP